MKVIVAPNAFKGALSAAEVAEAMAIGVRRALPQAEIRKVPLADGGDGTMETLVAATGGTIHQVTVSDPLGRPVVSGFGILGDGRTAVIEMAAASGLHLLQPQERNPMLTTTYGTGELVRAALEEDVEAILLGIGGSATTDGGTGLAQALGARFLDDEDQPLPGTGGNLERIRRIDLAEMDPRLRKVTVCCACDVSNPLTGEQGAAAVYSPQKGATAEMVKQLDAGLSNLAHVIQRDLGLKVDRIPGSGAAGGLGAGIVAFLGGQLVPGVDLVIQCSGLETALLGADLVLTGEGCIDRSTCYGKVPTGVARLCKARGIPVIAFGGSISEDAGCLHQEGVGAMFSICPGPMTLEEALALTASNLSRAVFEALLLWKASRDLPFDA